MSDSLHGSLFDLGSDGLGFIIPDSQPDSSYAFSLRNLRDNLARDFEEAGLHEGDRVRFRLNDRRQVEHVELIARP